MKIRPPRDCSRVRRKNNVIVIDVIAWLLFLGVIAMFVYSVISVLTGWW